MRSSVPLYAGIPLLGLALSEHPNAASIRMRVEGQRVDARQQPPFRAASELVTTAVTVRDADGRLITNLEKGDFIVEEDGVAQPITQFTKERVPVSLSLTLDISDSMRGQRMADARGALAHFLDKLLAEDDEASLLGFNHETRMFGQWTTERSGMRTKLEGIRPSGGTALYDAIDAALPLFESRQHPRAALLLVSDGADTASDVTPTALKQKLVRSDVFLYAIGINSIDAKNSTRINPYTLNELTSQGGGYTEIIAARRAGAATERIAEAESQYDWLRRRRRRKYHASVSVSRTRHTQFAPGAGRQ